MSKDKDKLLNNLSKFQKILENIIENLLSNENEEVNFIDFCENKIIEKIIYITNFKEKVINLKIIKSFALLIPNIKNKKIDYYLFSNNYMNQIICNISYNNTDDDLDYLSFYINFLKTIANKIDSDSFHLFFNRNYQRFPLFDEIIIFMTYEKDIMIKNTSRNIFLTLLKINYKPFIEYICDLPSITLFILFAENIKKQFKYFCTIRENKQNKNSPVKINSNNNIKNLFSELEERKELLVDDISFIQDILSINIPKINYLLINVIFYISLKYLFNNILLRQNADVSFYLLNLFLEVIKSQAIKNIIVFILYNSKIQINIIEIVANEEIDDIYKLLYLNIYAFRDNNIELEKNKLSFDDYIILNYSERFLNSLKYIKESDNTYIELKDISRKINNLDDKENETKIAIKLLNKKIKKMNIVLKKMEEYHNFISQATGINVGININSSCHSFLQIIHNDYDDILGLQENIFKNECIYYITNFHLSQYLCTVNEIFLIYQIIKDEDISKCLKFSLNLLNDISCNKGNNLNFINNSENNFIKNFDIAPLPSFKFNSVNNYRKIYENKSNIYKNLFGLEQTDKNNEVYLTSFLSLPDISNKTDVLLNDELNNLIVKNKKISYIEMDLNNEFFDKISLNKSNNELLILDNLINLILDSKKTLNKIIYKLNTEIIIELLNNEINICQINEDLGKRINEKYMQILQIIDDLLEKSTIEEQLKDKKYFYEFFGDSFILNTQEIFFIKKNYLNIYFFIIEEENLKDYNNKGTDLMKIPNEKYQLIKCLFQKFLSLYDLKIILNYKNNKNLTMKYQKFPLYFFDLSKFNEFDEVLFNELNILYFKLKYKTDKDSIFEKGIISIFQNMLILFNIKIIREENITNKNDSYIIDKMIPLRKVKINEIEIKEFDKSKFLNLNILNDDNNYYQLILLSETESELNIYKIKEIIIKEIKNAIKMEFLALKIYFKNLLDDESLNKGF